MSSSNASFFASLMDPAAFSGTAETNLPPLPLATSSPAPVVSAVAQRSINSASEGQQGSQFSPKRARVFSFPHDQYASIALSPPNSVDVLGSPPASAATSSSGFLGTATAAAASSLRLPATISFRAQTLAEAASLVGSPAAASTASAASFFGSPASTASSFGSPASRGGFLGSRASLTGFFGSPATTVYSPGNSTAGGSPLPNTPLRGLALNPLSPMSPLALDTKYDESLFITNAKAKRTVIEDCLGTPKNFSIHLHGQDVEMDGHSLERIGSGHYSHVYKCKTTNPLQEEWLVIRLFQEQTEFTLERKKRSRPQMHPRLVLQYLGNQFIRYAKVQTSELLSKHHAKFFTFDALIEKASQDPALRQEIEALMDEKEQKKRIAFAAKYLTDGYIVAEYAGATCQELKDMDFLNRIKTLYENRGIPLDPHPENWSTDLLMLDIFEDDSEDMELHVKAALKKIVGGDTGFKRFFETPANLSAEELKLTDWGKLLNSSPKADATAAAAGGAHA